MPPKNVNKVYKWHTSDLAKLIVRTVNDKYDFNLVISGLRGTSKSTLAYQIFRRLQRTEGRVQGTYIFNPKRDILYTQKDVLKAINRRWRSIIFCDEAIAVTFNRDFYLDDQKKIIKAMNMNRDHLNVIIFCIPTFASLDTQMKGMIKMRIHTVRRGFGIVQTPLRGIYAKDGWDTQNNEKIEREWSERGNIKPKYNRLTTFRGIIKFKDLPLKHRQLYESIKVAKRNEIIIEEEEKNMGKEKSLQKSAVARQLAIALEEGQIKTREEFDKFALVFGASPVDMVNKVRKYNRERGVMKKLNEYFSNDSIEDDGIKISPKSRLKKEIMNDLERRRPADLPDVLS